MQQQHHFSGAPDMPTIHQHTGHSHTKLTHQQHRSNQPALWIAAANPLQLARYMATMTQPCWMNIDIQYINLSMYTHHLFQHRHPSRCIHPTQPVLILTVTSSPCQQVVSTAQLVSTSPYSSICKQHTPTTSRHSISTNQQAKQWQAWQ